MDDEKKQLSAEQQARWNSSPGLRAEFCNDPNIFRAYSEAEADGKFRQSGGRVVTDAAQEGLTPQPATQAGAGRVRRIQDPTTGNWTTVPVVY